MTWDCACGARQIPEEVFSDRCPLCDLERQLCEVRRSELSAMIGGRNVSEQIGGFTLNYFAADPHPQCHSVGWIRAAPAKSAPARRSRWLWNLGNLLAWALLTAAIYFLASALR